MCARSRTQRFWLYPVEGGVTNFSGGLHRIPAGGFSRSTGSQNGFSRHRGTRFRTQVVGAHGFYPKSEMISREGGALSAETIFESVTQRIRLHPTGAKWTSLATERSKLIGVPSIARGPLFALSPCWAWDLPRSRQPSRIGWVGCRWKIPGDRPPENGDPRDPPQQCGTTAGLVDSTTPYRAQRGWGTTSPRAWTSVWSKVAGRSRQQVLEVASGIQFSAPLGRLRPLSESELQSAVSDSS